MENTKSTISISIDSEIKEQAQELFEGLGMNLNTAISMFLRHAIEFDGIPFEIRHYNKETEEAIRNVENGVNLSRPFTSVEELMEELLNADD